MSAVLRALKALQSPERPTSAAGRPPKGDQAGIMVCARIDPRIVIEMTELTGFTAGELVRLAVFAARRAKHGASDSELASTVRAWLKKAS